MIITSVADSSLVESSLVESPTVGARVGAGVGWPVPACDAPDVAEADATLESASR